MCFHYFRYSDDDYCCKILNSPLASTELVEGVKKFSKIMKFFNHVVLKVLMHT